MSDTLSTWSSLRNLRSQRSDNYFTYNPWEQGWKNLLRSYCFRKVVVSWREQIWYIWNVEIPLQYGFLLGFYFTIKKKWLWKGLQKGLRGLGISHYGEMDRQKKLVNDHEGNHKNHINQTFLLFCLIVFWQPMSSLKFLLVVLVMILQQKYW